MIRSTASTTDVTSSGSSACSRARASSSVRASAPPSWVWIALLRARARSTVARRRGRADAVESAFDAPHPPDRHHLIRAATFAGARPEVVASLERLPATQYTSLRELWRHMPDVPVGSGRPGPRTRRARPGQVTRIEIAAVGLPLGDFEDLIARARTMAGIPVVVAGRAVDPRHTAEA